MMRYSVALLVVLLAAVPTVRGEGDAAARVKAEVRELLAPVSGDEADTTAAANIAGLGSAVVPCLFKELAGGMSDFRGAARRLTILEALRLLPHSSLNSQLRALTKGDEVEVGSRICAIRILGAVGDRGSLDVLLAVAGEMDVSDLMIMPINRCVRTSIVQLLERCPENYQSLEGRWRILPPLLRTVALDAASERADVRALQFFGQLLELGGDDTLLLLKKMAAIGIHNPAPPRKGIADAVKAQLDSDDPEARRLAAIVTGMLHIADTCERLVELLDDEVPLTGIAAWRSLKTISGLSLSRERSRWEMWLSGEREWWKNDSKAEIASLGTLNAEQVVRIIATLGNRRLYRDSVALGLAPMLVHPNPRIRLATCKALEHLGSRKVIRDIADVLEDENQKVAKAKLSALQSLTGLDLPADREVWEAALRKKR